MLTAVAFLPNQGPTGKAGVLAPAGVEAAPNVARAALELMGVTRCVGIAKGA